MYFLLHLRQNEDATQPPTMPSVTDKDYVAERSGSPSVAEKDILVNYLSETSLNIIMI